MGTVRRDCRNVKRWRNAVMALRWTAAGMMEAAKGLHPQMGRRAIPAAFWHWLAPVKGVKVTD